MSYNQKVTAFIKANKGHTKAAMGIMQATVEHLTSEGDWTGAVRLLANVDNKMAKRMRMILGKVLDNATIVADSKQEHGLRFTKPKEDKSYRASNQFARFCELVEAGESIYSNAMDEFLEVEKQPTKPKSAGEVRAHIEAYCATHGFDILEVLEAPLPEKTTPIKKVA